MALYRTENTDILEPEFTDFSIESYGKREIVWNDPDLTDDEKILYLAQNDTGSTKIIFDIDRVINNNDMYQCDMIQVHYINVGSTTQKSPDIYDVTDLQVAQSYEECIGSEGTTLFIDNPAIMRYLFGLDTINFDRNLFSTTLRDVNDDNGFREALVQIVYNTSNKKYEIVEHEVTDIPGFEGTITIDRELFELLMLYLNDDDLMYNYSVRYTGEPTLLFPFEKDKEYKYMDREEQKLRFSWLINSNTTKYPGKVQFAIHFIRSSDDYDPADESTYGKVKYNFVTNVCDDIEVFATLDNSSEVDKTSAELLLKWRDQLMFTPSWTQNLENEEEDLSVLTLKREWDGKTVSSPKSLRGPQGIQGIQGIQGEIGPIGNTPKISIGEVRKQDYDKQEPEITVTYPTKEDGSDDLDNPVLNFNLPHPSCESLQTIDGGDPIYVFKGTKEEYNKFVEENGSDKNILGIVSDDDSVEKLQNDVKEVKEAAAILSNLNVEVKSNTYEINKIKTVVESTYDVQTNTVYKYEWYEDSKLSDPVVLTFPNIPETWDKVAIYQYFDENGEPLIINEASPANVKTRSAANGSGVINPDLADPDAGDVEGGSGDSGNENIPNITTTANCEIIYAPTGEECPSNDPDSWWNASGTSFTKDGLILNSEDINVKSEIDLVSAVYVELDGISKEIPLDGTYVIFENTKSDSIDPDMYDGDAIRRIVRAYNLGGDTAHVIVSTQIYCKGFEHDNVEDAIKSSNKTISYSYDPQGKYSDAAKTIKYCYAIGANELRGTVRIVSSSKVITEALPLTNESFSHDISDFMEYLKKNNIQLRLGDYIVDSAGELFKIMSVPLDGIPEVRLLRISRGTTDDIDMSSIKSAMRRLHTTKQTMVDENGNDYHQVTVSEDEVSGETFYIKMPEVPYGFTANEFWLQKAEAEGTVTSISVAVKNGGMLYMENDDGQWVEVENNNDADKGYFKVAVRGATKGTQIKIIGYLIPKALL